MMSKIYFVTATYRNLIAPIHGNAWYSVAERTAHGYTTKHPVVWFEEHRQYSSDRWDANLNHSVFDTILFYDDITDSGIDLETLQCFDVANKDKDGE